MTTLRLQAPKGKFRVIGVDTFSHEDWLDADFSTEVSARLRVDDIAKGKQMTRAYCYDDQGQYLYSEGSY